MKIPRVLITPGEPAGIGPDILVQAAQETWQAELCVIGDRELLLSRAQQLMLPLNLIPFHENALPQILPKGSLGFISTPLKHPCQAGKLHKDNAPYVLHTLEKAGQMALHKTVNAIVTAPVHKGILNEAGIPFHGHTEFFAEQAGVDKAVMMFVVKSALSGDLQGRELKVALVSTHLPLALVPQAITAEQLASTVRVLHQALVTQFHIHDPVILVCGLNPHAGENGHLGREELDVMIPVLEKLRKEKRNVVGPLSADTIFTEKFLKQADAILAMYHDQALPAVKCLGFGQAVNVTLGLPYIRTSVDHGTALDAAGTLQANASSLKAAITLAVELCIQNKGGHGPGGPLPTLH